VVRQRPDYVQRMTERGGRYLFHIVEEVDRRGMPTELALLPFIESAFNPQACRRAASGMWQFMPGTGGFRAAAERVPRRPARRAGVHPRGARLPADAARHVRRLAPGAGRLQLGPGQRAAAIARNQRAGLPTDYASLRMPDETRNYVPKLQAVKNIVAQPEAFGLTLPPLENHPYFLAVAIERDIDVDLAARLAGLPLDEFKQLNPQMNKPVILAAGTPQVLLPYDNANRFVPNWRSTAAPGQLDGLGRTEDPEAGRGRTPGGHDRSAAARGQPHPGPHAGQGRLHAAGAARRPRTEDVAEHIADHATMALAPRPAGSPQHRRRPASRTRPAPPPAPRQRRRSASRNAERRAGRASSTPQ
jgi:membrane-bound lytic murein transglycosylase D